MLKKIYPSLRNWNKTLRLSQWEGCVSIPRRYASEEVAEDLLPLAQYRLSEENKEAASKILLDLKDLNVLRLRYAEFLPDPDLKLRNRIREKLEHQDMIERRCRVDIPEFYVGSIVAVTSADKHSPEKRTRFLGICIQRGKTGLESYFLLRNVIENEGVEVKYMLYSPTIHSIEVLKCEKRLDNELLYLRDAPLEYSTFPFDMTPEFRNLDDEVPLNTLKVPLNPPPWIQRYERRHFKGVILPKLSKSRRDKMHIEDKPWEKYDLMLQYRQNHPVEEMSEIYAPIKDKLKDLEIKRNESIMNYVRQKKSKKMKQKESIKLP